MRISLLLEREPFPDILEKTLSQFWSQHFGQAITVKWGEGRPQSSHGQTWLVNAYLNAIFVPDVDEAVFDPIKREFSRSPVWWKRPFQQAYVQMASSRQTAQWMAHAYLTVSPAIPQAQNQLVIAGNHKVRWLDAKKGKVYGIRKAGFHNQFMRQEIEARQQAVACGIPVPALLDADTVSYDCFCEQFVSGTPINRLADKQQADMAVRQVYATLNNLCQQTATQVTISQYASELQQQITSLAETHHLLSDREKTVVCQYTNQLTTVLTPILDPITLVLAHGDFQPANILLNEDGAWLIDWEYATQRQQSYDVLVYQFTARTSEGLGQRLHQYIEHGLTISFNGTPSLDTAMKRQQIAHLFMLEECHFQLTQTNQPLFTTLGSGWADWLQTYSQWAVDAQQELSFD